MDRYGGKKAMSKEIIKVKTGETWKLGSRDGITHSIGVNCSAMMQGERNVFENILLLSS